MASTPVAQLNPTLAEIDRLGIGYSEDAQYDVAKLIEGGHRVQVRDSDHYAPKDEVERYAQQMSSSLFPPIVVTKDGYLVDGNTRAHAVRLSGSSFFPAYVLDVAYEDDRHKDDLQILAATLNQKNGRSLSKAEARQSASAMINKEWKPEQIARALGLKPAAVTQIKKEIAAKARLNGAGEKVGGASLRALGSGPALELNNEPYLSLAQLAGDAGLNSTEIISVAKEAKATGSDKNALAKIAEVRSEMSSRIRQKELTGKSTPPAARQARQHLGFINKFVGREDELTETNDDIAPQHVETIQTAITVLQAVLSTQKVPAEV